MTPVPLRDLSFVQYLETRSCSLRSIHGLLNHPIVTVRTDEGQSREYNLLQYTYGMNYADAYDAIRRIESQVLLSRHFAIDERAMRGAPKTA